ncbi:hypothetical protein [Streptomyces griseorubiginosus]|uniref:hypothetical protein n=1 Tax=Streptomyces griseorubiginosus TaxID=67304 RepID=UPI003455F1A0
MVDVQADHGSLDDREGAVGRSPGGRVHVRLNRGGNRTVNHALHMIALTQVRGDGEGAAYFARQLTAGKTKTEALRLLRRRISDRFHRALLADQADLDQPLNPLPPTPMSLAA